MRAERFARSVQEELSTLLSSVKDRRVSEAGLLTITHVRVSNDLGVARVQIAVMPYGGGEIDMEQTAALLEGLARAAPYLRRELGRSLQSKKIPELRFHFDETGERAERVEAILAEIKAAAPSVPAPDADADVDPGDPGDVD